MKASPSHLTAVVGLLVALFWSSGSAATMLLESPAQAPTSSRWHADVTPLPLRPFQVRLDRDERLSLFGLEDGSRGLSPFNSDFDAAGEPQSRGAPQRLVHAGMGLDASDIVGSRGDSPVPLPGAFWLMASGLLVVLLWQWPLLFHPRRA